MTAPLLNVDALSVHFATADGELCAVDGVSFAISKGETLGIVGESGSGKSQTVLALLGLLSANGRASGRAVFNGRDLLDLPIRDLNQVRGKEVSMIFQDPMTSLNPYLSIATQMTEVLALHQRLGRSAARAQALQMLAAVGIAAPERRIDQYPHEFSGGMRQRVMIAMALLCDPHLLIADEPTTALDVTVQAQTVGLMRELQTQRDTAIILITHDLGVVAGLCDRIAVMYAGRIVETGPVDAMFSDPQHPYTRGLLTSVPRLDEITGERLATIPGNPPAITQRPRGCAYRDRCAYAFAACAEHPPPLQTVINGRAKACHLEVLP